MTRARRILIFIGTLIIAGLLAFPLREMIYETIVVPAAFIAWNLDLLYRSYPQWIWWFVVLFIVFLMIAFSLGPRPQSRGRVEEKPKPQQGQVEGLAIGLRRAEHGIYFRWVIANRLGKLAYQILLHRESGRPRSVFAPLLGTDWEPTKELQNYLETGLHGSFADFPNVRRFSSTPQKTPLDINVADAVEFLESQVENGRSGF
ncbi:MAG TPA: hypothetical protein VMN99_13905 [Anaerolineales bacterium]|nr:hypothetical protein [Anaerolineales bacterium]